MVQWLLLTDGSVNPQTKTGYGAYLLLTSDAIFNPIDELKSKIKVHAFTETSSTKIELETLLWALSNINVPNLSLTVYTDSQNILRLPQRRKRFEKNNYHTQKGLPIKNTALYQDFFKMKDDLHFNIS